MPQVREHHRPRPDLPDRIGDLPAEDVRRAAVHGLEARRVRALRVEVGRRRDADGARACRPEIGQDVTEQVRAHHHVEPVGMLHEVRGQDVNVVLRRLHVRILCRHQLEPLVPVRHRDRDPVRLGRARDVLPRSRPREFEGVAEDPVHAAPCEHGLLRHGFLRRAFARALADGRVLAFGVLAHHPEVDVAGLPVRERRRHAGHEAHGAQVHVLLELPANRDQQAPQRHVVGNAGEAHRAEEDRVVMADGREAVLGHHPAVLRVIRAAPVLLVPHQGETELPRRRLEHALSLGHHFLADAVAGDHGNAMGRHDVGAKPRASSVGPRGARAVIATCPAAA